MNDSPVTLFGPFEWSHLSGVALALAIGLLVGVQRGWVQRDAEPGTRFAGIRTYGLFGMAGGVAGVLFAQASWPATVVLASAAALVVVGYWRAGRIGTVSGNVSGTGSISALLTLACGFLAGAGEGVLGAAVAVAMVLLLLMRERLHGWVARLSEQEVLAIARFALIALVILPLLPDRGFGPYEAWNPRSLWLVVVLVSGLSFAGYFSGKVLGPGRGVLAMAATGSMVSSTAVTVALATRMRDGDGDQASLSAGIALASVVMLLRVVVLVGLLAPFALVPFVLLAVPAMLASLLPTAWWIRRMASNGTGAAMPDMRLRNPLALGPALLLTVMVMVMTVAAHWVMERFGDAGLAVVLAVSGSVDVDSAIITMGSLPPGTLEPALAGVILAIPPMLNSVVKAVLALSIAGWAQARGAAMVLVATAAVLLAGVLL